MGSGVRKMKQETRKFNNRHRKYTSNVAFQTQEQNTQIGRTEEKLEGNSQLQEETSISFLEINHWLQLQLIVPTESCIKACGNTFPMGVSTPCKYPLCSQVMRNRG